MADVSLLQVEVRGRQGLVFSGELYAISSFNDVGRFDVLPSHANFVSMISRKVILQRADGQKEEIGVDNGVMVVEENAVKVFLGVSKM